MVNNHRHFVGSGTLEGQDPGLEHQQESIVPLQKLSLFIPRQGRTRQHRPLSTLQCHVHNLQKTVNTLLQVFHFI
jgi:hypothetical protein